MIFFILAEMRGDRVGEYGPIAGIVGFAAVALFFYVIAGGPTRRGPRK